MEWLDDSQMSNRSDLYYIDASTGFGGYTNFEDAKQTKGTAQFETLVGENAKRQLFRRGGDVNLYQNVERSTMIKFGLDDNVVFPTPWKKLFPPDIVQYGGTATNIGPYQNYGKASG